MADDTAVLESVKELARTFAAGRRERQPRRELDPRDFAALRDAGFPLTGVPADRGGLWVDVPHSTRPIAAILRALARGDPSVALVSSMHPAVLSFWLATPDVPAPFKDAWLTQRQEVTQSAAGGAWWGTITSEPGSGGDVANTKAAASSHAGQVCLGCEQIPVGCSDRAKGGIVYASLGHRVPVFQPRSAVTLAFPPFGPGAGVYVPEHRTIQPAAVSSRSSVLVVEDHSHVAKSIRRGLMSEGYAVRVAVSGDEGCALACLGSYDLVVLDVMLPGTSGFEILSEMRKRHVATPVLVLTARAGLNDRLRGFEGGADDYLGKPFALPELLARVRALLTRTRARSVSRLKVADLELDLISRRVSRAGRPIDLAPKEFELLAYLMSNAGKVVSREMLGQHVWDALSRGTPLDNVIDVHVGRLRRKIDSDCTPRLIQTVRGLGFVIAQGEDP